MDKEILYEILAKRQDCTAESLKNPQTWDSLSVLINQMVVDADDYDEIDSDLQYSITMLTRALHELRLHTDKLTLKQ